MFLIYGRFLGVRAEAAAHHRAAADAREADADVALFDGDPFEYTTHCSGVVIDGVRFLGTAR